MSILRLSFLSHFAGSALAGFSACALAADPPGTGTAAAPAIDATAAAPSMMGELLGIVVPLALIILVLLAVLYVARRRFGLTGQDAPLTVLQILPVGPRERVVLIKARSGRVFAVGVAGQSVNLITDLNPCDLQSPDHPTAAPAADASDISTAR